MTMDAQQLAALSADEKRALLAALLKKKAAQPSPNQAIPRQSRDCETFPLAFAQQRLWYLDQLEPGNHAYHLPITMHLKGNLNKDALEESLNQVIIRHEMLRTNFMAVNGEPFQRISPSRALVLPVIDLGHLPSGEQAEELERQVKEMIQQPFDLAEDLLVRAALFRLAPNEHLFLLVVHHIAGDGWSLSLFAHELTTFYKAIVTGEAASLPPLSIQYVDFACWQQDSIQKGMLAEQLEYWKKQLGGDLAPLALPLDYPRPPVQTFRGGRETLDLSVELSQALKSLSQREGATLFMTLLATFKLLLYRYTGQIDIIVGSPIAGRNRSEVERLIGIFINMLALRTELGDDISFRELLGRVKKTALEAYDHQEIPFEGLLAELRPERSRSHTPVFQVLFNMLNMRGLQFELPDLAIETPVPREAGSLFDFTLYASDWDEKIRFIFTYNADLFNQARMAEMLAQYQHLLEQIVAAPDQSIAAYSLVTSRSRPLLPDPKQALPEPAYELLPQTFLSWAARSPNHPAISQDSRVWTYEALAQTSQALAQLLLSQGLGKGEVVAVCGPRSFGLIAGIISVFLSGGVLLTLDQNLPAHRQQMMLQSAKAKRLFYVGPQRPEDAWMREALDITSIEPATGLPANLAQAIPPASIPLPELGSDDAAYVFFTSGTTGVPKGILGCHKGLAHFLSWQRQTFEVGPHDRSAQLTGLSFDVVLRDIFLPLTSGATLCLPAEDVSLAPAQILPWLEREQISLLHTVPSLVQSWLMDVPPDLSLRKLRWIFSAGEPLTDILIRQWRKAFPEAGRMVNIYGPTETTLAKCFYLVPTEDILPGVQPVGSTLPETQALVLNKYQQVCGIGEAGEIVIRTPFRSLGYINASEENEQHFVKNPFRDDPRDLLYYTGDRGRYRPDGLVEILGRLDHQVKIRGVRIEPGEIAAVLGQHPAVHQAVVVAWDDGSADKSLVAYVVPARNETPTVSDLGRFLRQRLPEYMIPSAFILMESLPLTANKKLDRKALPAPDQIRPELQANFVAPRSETEDRLAQIWAELLRLEQIGVYDNFFELGGHSLLATQLISRVSKAFEVDILLRTFFEAPTVADLALMITQVKAAAVDDEELMQILADLDNLSLDDTQPALKADA